VPIHRLPLDQAIARVEQRLTVRPFAAVEPVK